MYGACSYLVHVPWKVTISLDEFLIIKGFPQMVICPYWHGQYQSLLLLSWNHHFCLKRGGKNYGLHWDQTHLLLIIVVVAFFFGASHMEAGGGGKSIRDRNKEGVIKGKNKNLRQCMVKEIVMWIELLIINSQTGDCIFVTVALGVLVGVVFRIGYFSYFKSSASSLLIFFTIGGPSYATAV